MSLQEGGKESFDEEEERCDGEAMKQGKLAASRSWENILECFLPKASGRNLPADTLMLAPEDSFRTPAL